MLGVIKEYRDAGVGRMLKLEQRKEALARGIELMEWTFDPLEIKNAYFNIERLGAVVRRFVAEPVRNHFQRVACRTSHGSMRRRMVACEPARRMRFSPAREPLRAPREAAIAVPASIYEIKAKRSRRTPAKFKSA